MGLKRERREAGLGEGEANAVGLDDGEHEEINKPFNTP